MRRPSLFCTNEADVFRRQRPDQEDFLRDRFTTGDGTRSVFRLFLNSNITLNLYFCGAAFFNGFRAGNGIMRQFLKAFAREESGGSAIEYSIIVGVISLGIIAGSVTLAEAMGFKFMEFARDLYVAF